MRPPRVSKEAAAALRAGSLRAENIRPLVLEIARDIERAQVSLRAAKQRLALVCKELVS